ncbi:MAG TPA: hypothetical protein VHU83_11630 [Bryobacteraceae bacterium]|jgi:hypothetical protein|nr:hypothetical protein [Bryobacteraceae bacterium]
MARRDPKQVIKAVNVRHISYGSGLVISRSVQTGEWALLSAHMPGRKPEPMGILLRDPIDGLHIKLRMDWSGIILDEEEIEIWRAIAEDLEAKGREVGGDCLLDWLEDTASHSLRIGARERVEVSDAQTIVGELYQRYVDSRYPLKCERNAK